MQRRFLDVRALASLEHTRFTTRHRIDGAYTGRHKSRMRGGAGEFVDFRQYVEGEDLRRLDWKTLARTGRAYVRLYQDETNLDCTIILDASESMQFGATGRKGLKGSKLEYAQYLCTAFSYMICRQQDRVGLAVVSGDLREHIPPAGTQEHLQRIFDRIESLETEPATNLATSMRKLFQALARRGTLIILSDFLVDDLESVFASIRLFRHRRCEVVLLHLIHPDEERLPDGVAYRFEGMEQEGRVDCTPLEIRKLYQQRFEAHAAAVRSMALAAGCEYKRVSTAIPYLQTLGAFLVERAG